MADPLTDFPEGLRQPDRRSCGAACLVVAHALRRPDYARDVARGNGFRDEVLAMHHRVTSLVDVRGRPQPPWPRALGTPPWAVARQLEGSTGVPHRVVPLLGGELAAAYGAILRSPLPTVLYVGSTWLPRHVVLVVAAEPGSLRVYEPAQGRVEWVTPDAFVGRRLGLGGWDVPWGAVMAAR